MTIPAFDRQVPRNGYAWWYLDTISADRRYGLTLIAFIGSVFSPYYARARARGEGDPMAYCAINLALYGPGGRWCMTERGSKSLKRQADALTIGPSALSWSGDRLDIDINEWSVPIPRRVLGRITVCPTIHCKETIALSADARHRWSPVFPQAAVSVNFRIPRLSWSGTGYLDHNAGSEPLEQCFDSWSWSRAASRAGPLVLYDTQPSHARPRTMALRFNRDGRIEKFNSPAPVSLPRSRWGMDRPTRSEDGTARLVASWEDTPFYARSLVNTRLLGESVTAVHESLSLRRFSAWWVRLMLPFRMPRIAD